MRVVEKGRHEREQLYVELDKRGILRTDCGLLAVQRSATVSIV